MADKEIKCNLRTISVSRKIIPSENLKNRKVKLNFGSTSLVYLCSWLKIALKTVIFQFPPRAIIY